MRGSITSEKLSLSKISSPRWMPRSSGFHSRWIWGQLSTRNSFGIKHSSLILFMTSTSLTEYSLRCYMDLLDTVWARTGGRIKLLQFMILHDMRLLWSICNRDRVGRTLLTSKQRITTALNSQLIRGVLQSLQQLPTLTQTQRQHLVYNHHQQLPYCWLHSSCPTQLLVTPQPSHRRHLHKISIIVVSFFPLQIRQRCNFVPEQLCTLFINRCTANEPVLPSRRSNQTKRTALLRKRNNQPPLLPMMQRSVTGAPGPLPVGPSSRSASQPPLKTKDWAKTGGAFSILVQPSRWRPPWQGGKYHPSKRFRRIYHRSQNLNPSYWLQLLLGIRQYSHHENLGSSVECSVCFWHCLWRGGT